MAETLALDGLPAMRIKRHSLEKHYFVRRYMDIFSKGMSNRWQNRIYVDLFSGPGVAMLEGDLVEHVTPARYALELGGFTAIHLNDADGDTASVLRHRVGNDHRVKVTNHDANDAAEAVGPTLRAPGTLALVFIDPYAYQFKFASFKPLVLGTRADLIVTCMTGNAKRFLGQPQNARDFEGWIPPDQHQALLAMPSLNTRDILDRYEAGLKGAGYHYINDTERVTTPSSTTIYHLLFASRHPRGKDFFDKISAKGPHGQQRLL